MKDRLDSLIVDRGLAESRHRAQAMILAGAVKVDGSRVLKAGKLIYPDSTIEIDRPEDEYVSRGALKLAAALDTFQLQVDGKTAVDVGASTGGFTDVLLRRGARRVYAIDVGYGQFSWRLRQDPRVVVMERTNFRHLDALPEPTELAVVDVSFISLALILPTLTRLTTPHADAVVLVKPQFEAGRDNVRKAGVVRDPAVHRLVLETVLGNAITGGWLPVGLIESPIRGPSGNREFLAHMIKSVDPKAAITEQLIAGVLGAA